MLNPVIFLSRSMLVAVAATFAVVAVRVLIDVLGIGQLVGDGITGVLFAVGLACAGIFYGHQQVKKSTSPLVVQFRLFLLQFAMFLFILSTLRYAPIYFTLFGRVLPAGAVVTPILVALWLMYWCWKNILTISDDHAHAIGTNRRELALMCLGLLLIPYLLLIPGFSLAEVFGFSPELIFSVFLFGPIMSAALPIALSLRKLARVRTT